MLLQGLQHPDQNQSLLPFCLRGSSARRERVEEVQCEWVTAFRVQLREAERCQLLLGRWLVANAQTTHHQITVVVFNMAASCIRWCSMQQAQEDQRPLRIPSWQPLNSVTVIVLLQSWL